MQLFYIPGISGEICTMNPQESHHCIKVLRMGKGEEIRFVDGTGGFYEGTIIDNDPVKCQVQITHRVMDFEKRDFQLHVAIAPTKNIDRFEWFLEKATEIGIDTITPLICQRSERRKLRPDRLENVLVSAMKQSLKALKPELKPMATLDDFLENDFNMVSCFVAHCMEDRMRSDLLFAEGKGDNYLVLIGPEGDFTSEEVEHSIESGFLPVSLGMSRLRTETAGVVAAQIISDRMCLKRNR